jgi:hypothetical protein
MVLGHPLSKWPSKNKSRKSSNPRQQFPIWSHHKLLSMASSCVVFPHTTHTIHIPTPWISSC